MESDATRSTNTSRVWLGVGALTFILGGVLAIIGIGGIAREDGRIRHDAIATGTVTPPGVDPVEMTFTSGARRTYSIYIEIDTNDSTLRAAVVGDTSCVVTPASGEPISVDGGRQSGTNTTGHLSSVGSFVAPAGDAALRCTQTGFTRPHESFAFFVTPGTTNLTGDIVLILVGTGLLVFSVVAGIKAFRRSR